MTNDVAALARVVRDGVARHARPRRRRLVARRHPGAVRRVGPRRLPGQRAEGHRAAARHHRLRRLARRRWRARKKHPYRGTYFDFLSYKKNADDGSVPSTPSIPHFYALAAQLEHIVRGETLEARYRAPRGACATSTIERTARYAQARLRSARTPPPPSPRSQPSRNPDEIRAEMKKRGYTLGGGYGAVEGRRRSASGTWAT